MDRPSPRERRQGAILDAAEALFLEQGYERTSLAEIVKRSGGSLATLYELFGNKQGLLHAITVRWHAGTMFRSLDADAASALSSIAILESHARAHREMMESPRTIALMRMLVSESLRDREFALQIYRDFRLPAIRELTDLFSGWHEAGKAEIDDPEAAAKLFLNIIAGDTMLNTLAGIDDELLDTRQVDWRLQLFISHFQIR